MSAPEPLREALAALADDWECKAELLVTRGGSSEPYSELLAAQHRLHAKPLRDLLDAHPAPVGVELTDAERRDLSVALYGRGHEDWLTAGPLLEAVKRIIAARQAPIMLDRKAVLTTVLSVLTNGDNYPLSTAIALWGRDCAPLGNLVTDAVLALPGVTVAPDENVVARALSEHRFPGEFLTALGEAWVICSCGERVNLEVVGGRHVVVEGAARAFEEHQSAAVMNHLHAATNPPVDLAEDTDAATPAPAMQNLILCGNDCGHDHNSENGPSGHCSKHGPEPVPYLYYCHRCHADRIGGE